MKKTVYLILVLFTMSTAVTTFTSCRENKSASEQLDDAGDNIEDGVEDAGDAIEDGAEETGDAIEDAVD